MRFIVESTFKQAPTPELLGDLGAFAQTLPGARFDRRA